MNFLEQQSDSLRFPSIMGIVNVTLDSFSDGGKFYNTDSAIQHASDLIRQGADLLDVGGQSTRPGAEQISIEEELRRVLPVIEGIRRQYSTIPISIDTTRSDVAEQALQAGASMLNDISGLQYDPRMAEVASVYNVPLCLMHIQGTPQTMQIQPQYQDVVREVYGFLETQITYARSVGVKNIIADVGIGFGKTYEHNLTLLRSMPSFASLGVPMLLGLSRKSLFKKMFAGMEESASVVDYPEERDMITMILHTLVQTDCIGIIRVHNVQYAHQARIVWQAFHNLNDINDVTL